MAFCSTLLLCLFSLAHDTVLTEVAVGVSEVAVGASSSSLWLEHAGPPVLVSWLSRHAFDPLSVPLSSLFLVLLERKPLEQI